MPNFNKTPDFLKMAQGLKKDAVRFASVAGVEFFKDSFHKQGFTDTSFQGWPQRKDDVDPGRKILIKSAFLMNSIQVFSASGKQIVFGSDAEYAEIHNSGGTVSIPITPKSKKYFWFMFKATGNTMWKALALTKKGSITVNIPKRQFIGHSKTLMDSLDTWLVNEIEKRFKTHLK